MTYARRVQDEVKEAVQDAWYGAAPPEDVHKDVGELVYTNLRIPLNGIVDRVTHPYWCLRKWGRTR